MKTVAFPIAIGALTLIKTAGIKENTEKRCGNINVKQLKDSRVTITFNKETTVFRNNSKQLK